MFLIVIDTVNKELQWVRAGHDPALVYDPVKTSFKELNGNGTVLGIDAAFTFEENTLSGWSEGQIIVISTDGVWETENSHSEKFGKFRLRQIIRQHRQFPAQEILNAIFNALNEFRGTAPQSDDVTLVIVKAKK
jgi:sigma-B regulation protein RsbU (phosphoserine phosphatase)